MIVNATSLWIWGVAALVLGVLIGCGVSNPHFGGQETYVERLDRSLGATGGKWLDARTTNGGIALEGSGGHQVSVRVRKEVRAPSLEEAQAFAGKVQVNLEQRGDEIRLSKTHPRPPDGFSVAVEYDIHCPPGLDVRLGTENGSIQVRRMEGSVDAATTNGNVELDGGDGRIKLKTLNGTIEALVGELQTEGQFSTTNGSVVVQIERGIAPVAATTVNGSVDVTLPADFSGQLDARTVNGRVRSEFANSQASGKLQDRIYGPLGSGGSATVMLRATNGNVDLRMGRSK
jgi:DUF4097 and DUF4098 domain-containing protein YvlB